CMQSEEKDGPVTPLFTVPEFQQRLLRFDGRSDEHRDRERDEVLYVLEGSAVVTVGGEEQELGPGTGVFVARGTPWRVEAAEGLKAPSPALQPPPPAAARPAGVPRRRPAAAAGRR